MLWAAKSISLTTLLAPCLWSRAMAARVATVHQVGLDISAGACKESAICIASANKELDHDATFRELFEGCLQANPSTEVVALALQDFPGGEIPKYISDLPGLDDNRFKLRHQFMLTDKVGEGHFCYGKFAGGAWATAVLGTVAGAKVGVWWKGVGAIPGAIVGFFGGAIMGHFGSSALGANCGGVSLIVYSLKKVKVSFDVQDGNTFLTQAANDSDDLSDDAEEDQTATTMKGTVAALFGVNGRSLVFASTHGTEGVRGKSQGTACPLAPTANLDALEKEVGLRALEQKRVRQFRRGLGRITALRQATDAGVLWAGDFNPRTADHATGCPLWPRRGEEATAGLDRLQGGRDILGEDPAAPGSLATFSGELAGTGLAEIQGLSCPTYKKMKAKKAKEAVAKGDSAAIFSCLEGSEEMFYKPSHPPSWPDRIIGSVDVPWLKCGDSHRVAHKSDHDAILVACVVSGPEC